MTAFSYTASNQIKENIRSLFRRVKSVSKIPMSHEQFSSLFIPAEHRMMYRDMSMLAHTGEERRMRFQWGTTHLLFKMNHWQGQPPLPIPRNPCLQHDAPKELTSDIASWVNNGGDASGDFGRVRALFVWLNDNLTKGQIRFVWPSILAILGTNEVLSETLKELQEVRIPSKGPELPRGLLAICRKTAGAIASASLIPNDVPEFEEGAGCIEIVDGQQYDELGLGAFTGLT